jgi:peptide deformylase
MARWRTLLKIITYPHPTLRHVSKPIRRVDNELRGIIREMFRLMYEAHGIGLAANQVDLPLRFFICNLAGEPEQGEEMVFINPVLSRAKGQDEQEEGCLSLPGLHAPVKRPETVYVEAYQLDGSAIGAHLDGLLSRVVQHETDHLNGVLFTDRLSVTGELDVQLALEEFEVDFRSRRECGEIPSDEQIATRLAELEQQYALLETS